MKACVIGGLKSIIRKFEINNRRPEINNRRAVEAQQILSYRDICRDARFAINCQGKVTLELILKAPMCVYNMN